MQFTPATWATYGVDGDGDGRADIRNNADSAMSAANYLTASGVTAGQDGVRRAIYAYNHADWYVNDVLYYAAAYGGGTVPGDPSDCGPGGTGNPDLPPIDNQKITALLTWAQGHIGNPYVFGATGPGAWDCSGFTQAAYAQIGVSLPRTAAAQRNWLAAGNGSARHPRPGAARRPHLRRLLPRAKPDRARHARLRPGQAPHHRSRRPPRRQLRLQPLGQPPHLRDLASRRGHVLSPGPPVVHATSAWLGNGVGLGSEWRAVRLRRSETSERR